VPSHIDPVPDNILLMPDNAAPAVWFVDWEYSAPAAAAWDLADFAIEAALDTAEQAALLAAYAGSYASRLEPAFRLYQALLDLLAAAWGASQNALPGHRTDHRHLIATRLARACAALDGPEFGRLVADAARDGAHSAIAGH
jgi:thiamine kinase-like enzyme